MRKNFIFISAFIFILSSCAVKSSHNEKNTIGNLTLSEIHPHPGDSLSILFNNSDSSSSSKNLTAYYYITVGKSIYGYDLSLTREDSLFKGKIAIPDSATALAFAFYPSDGNMDNNNQQGYLQFLYGEKDSILPGSKASIGYLQRVFSRYLGVKSNLDTVLRLIKTDMDANTAVALTWENTYRSFLMNTDSVKGREYANELIKKYTTKKELSSKEYLLLAQVYASLGKENLRDSLLAIGAKKFPSEKIAHAAFVNKFDKAATLNDKKTIFEQYTTQFKSGTTEKDHMLLILADAALNVEDYALYQQYINQLSTMQLRARKYNGVAWNLAEQGEDLPAAEAMAQQAVHYVDTTFNTDKHSYMPPSMHKQILLRYFQMMSDTYAYILFKEGKIKEAVKQEKNAVGPGLEPEINERYIQFLMAAKDEQTALNEAAKFIASGAFTQKLIGFYKTAYVSVKGSNEGLDIALQELKNKANKKQLDELKASMTNKPLPDFFLVTQNGDTLHTKDFMGKYTILDFWATWCGPCKASFPGMKILVNKYTDNKNVQFYFVNTFERAPKTIQERHEKVAQFMQAHNYPFEVLYDVNDNNHFHTSAAFDINGIPTKIIIGPDGRWNFTKVGFGGNTENMVKEVELMLQLLHQKNAKN